MTDQILFPFSEYWWFYFIFSGFILLLLLLDLGIFHRKAHEVSFKEAMVWSCIWIGLALVFNLVFYRFCLYKFSTDPTLLSIPGFLPSKVASQKALEFLTGVLIEKSLATDNVFVFVLIFSYFAIPLKYQHRVFPE